MLKRIRPRVRGNGPWVLVSAIGVALLVTPFAVAAGEGRPLDGGARNPSNNASQEYNRETEIIAGVSTYGTRQSNKSNNGGGAIYGCRSGAGGTPANNEPCIRANNLAAGLAFEFAFEGTTGGTITSQTPGATRKPFTTNATGVATGLNADQVDGQSATEIANAGAATANRFAQVSVAGGLGNNRGATAAANPGGLGTYTVTFSGNISGCALGATVSSTAGGAASVGLTANNSTVDVVTRDPDGTPADHPFHITVTC